VLKTTQSGYEGFLRDEFTLLPEVRDRIMATSVTATWKVRGPQRGGWKGRGGQGGQSKAAGVCGCVLTCEVDGIECGRHGHALETTVCRPEAMPLTAARLTRVQCLCTEPKPSG
jgi:hypothetical protein